MTSNRPTRRPAALLVLSALVAAGFASGCEANGGTPGDQAGVDEAPQSTPADAGESTGSSETAAPSAEEPKVTSLRESFDDDANGWALPPTEEATTEVVGGDFVWDIKQPGLRPHVIATTLGMAYDAGQLEMTDVRVTASVTPRRGAAAFGLFCREVPDTDADFKWYEFVVRDGYSAIRLADSAGNLEPLAEGVAVVPTAEPAELEATCVDRDGQAGLTLSVNGNEVLETSVPDPLGNGAAGLQAYNAPPEESDEGSLLAWHDFAVEPAP